MQNDFISTKVRESMINSKENTDSFQVTAHGTLALASPKRLEYINRKKSSCETSNMPLDPSLHINKQMTSEQTITTGQNKIRPKTNNEEKLFNSNSSPSKRP